MIILCHSCLNCEEEISNSSQKDYQESLGYLLCSEKCMKELNDCFHETYPNKPNAYDMKDVWKK